MMRTMDSETCAKRLRSTDLHTKEHGRRKVFSRASNSGFGQEVAKRFFPGASQQW